MNRGNKSAVPLKEAAKSRNIRKDATSLYAQAPGESLKTYALLPHEQKF